MGSKVEKQWNEVISRTMAEMPYRYMGSSGLRVSSLGMGTWVTIGGQVEDVEESERLLQTAYECGVNLFDTAEVYAGGRAEEILGNTIIKNKWKRSSFVITTKIFWGGRGENERGLSRKHIIEGLNGSLRRLQLDYVDVVMAHRPDPHTPMEETVRAMDHVINKGKALYWGTSQWSAAEIMEAHATARTHGLIPPAVEEPEYNMFHRDQVEGDLLNAFEKIQIGAFTWSPLASGLLTGKYSGDDQVPPGSRASLKGYEWLRSKILSDEWQSRFKKMNDLRSIAKRLSATLPQLAIAWCLANNDVSSVLIGASSPAQLLENIKAVKILHSITPEIMLEINQLLANKPIGKRDFRHNI